MGSAVLWLRRDLRLHDHPALTAAGSEGKVLPLFVVDPALAEPSGAARLAFLYRTLTELDRDLSDAGGRLIVRHGRPEKIVPAVAKECGARSVHVTRDFGPYGSVRDAAVAEALGDVPLVGNGSPYAVSPGKVTTKNGDTYKVFTAFYRAWCDRGWPAPAETVPNDVEWVTAGSEPVPADPGLGGSVDLPPAGERAALEAWESFRARRLGRYDRDRDRPGADGTSRMSPYLKFGSIHPRTMLAGIGHSDETFKKELAWREFYAAVLARWPESARTSFQPVMARMPWSSGKKADEHWEAWTTGRTGYPVVDAGMRQLLAEGWMHNRGMIVASFLVKDLHIDWVRGARHFMLHLVDGDLASNQHGWQWTAGTGTDAAPFHRIFNPVSQSRTFDPDGDYIRRYVPELAGVRAPVIHEPWRNPEGPPRGYPAPIVDHAEERAKSLATYHELH